MMIRSTNSSPQTSTKKYACTSCAKSFRRTEHLARHLLTHSGEKPFYCTDCSRGFSRLDALQRHVRSYHAQSASAVKPAARKRAKTSSSSSTSSSSDLVHHLTDSASQNDFDDRTSEGSFESSSRVLSSHVNLVPVNVKICALRHYDDITEQQQQLPPSLHHASPPIIVPQYNHHIPPPSVVVYRPLSSSAKSNSPPLPPSAAAYNNTLPPPVNNQSHQYQAPSHSQDLGSISPLLGSASMSHTLLPSTPYPSPPCLSNSVMNTTIVSTTTSTAENTLMPLVSAALAQPRVQISSLAGAASSLSSSSSSTETLQSYTHRHTLYPRSESPFHVDPFHQLHLSSLIASKELVEPNHRHSRIIPSSLSSSCSSSLYSCSSSSSSSSSLSLKSLSSDSVSISTARLSDSNSSDRLRIENIIN